MFKFFFPATPSPKELTQQELEHHQRCLVVARQSLAYADANVQYHQRAINDLKRSLQTEFEEVEQ